MLSPAVFQHDFGLTSNVNNGSVQSIVGYPAISSPGNSPPCTFTFQIHCTQTPVLSGSIPTSLDVWPQRPRIQIHCKRWMSYE